MMEPIWIDARDAEALHNRLLDLFGGLSGVRDDALLESALARPRQSYAYALDSDLVNLAMLYASGVIRNHPFIDGNKRTGFLIGILFLELNGCRFTAEEEQTTKAVLALASGISDERDYESFLRENVCQ